MADPTLALSVRPPQVPSIADATEHAVRIADMLSMQAQRQQQAREYGEEAPIRQAERKARLDSINEAEAYKAAFNQGAKYDEKKGDIDFDLPKMSTFLSSRNMGHLIPKISSDVGTYRTSIRTKALQDAENELEATTREGDIAEQWLALDKSKRAEHYLTVKRTLVALDEKLADTLPNQYDDTVDAIMEGVVEQRDLRRTMSKRLTAAEDREKFQRTEDRKLDAREQWRKATGRDEDPPVWVENAIAAQKMGVTAPSATSLANQAAALRRLGIRINAAGEEEPIPRNELSLKERADLEAAEAGPALKRAQTEAAEARADLDKAKANPNSDAYKAAQRRLDIAQQNADTAKSRLGLDEKELAIRKTGTPIQVSNVILRVQDDIRALKLTGAAAKAKWDQQRALIKAVGVDIGEYVEPAAVPKKPSEAAIAALPKPGMFSKTATPDTFRQYLDVYKTPEAAEKALKDAGWK